MKTKSKKKIVVSVLALAMGAGLAGSISGSVAWYQYSTRTSAAFAGASAGTSRNLQISNNGGSSWSQHIDIYADPEDHTKPFTFRPVSVYGEAGSLNFVDHPVYKTAILPAAAGTETEYKRTYEFVFKCEDTTNAGKAQVAKDVYLTHLAIVNKSTEDRNITPAVRVEINGVNKFIVATTAGTTTTNGKLDLNNNSKDDKDGWDTNDINGNDVVYRNATSLNQQEDDGRGMSYVSKAPTGEQGVTVDASDPYHFTGIENRLLTTTKTGTAVSDVVKITVWIEGWQTLGGKTLWDNGWINQNFEVQFQFACEADHN